jgi:hypothetical protein
MWSSSIPTYVDLRQEISINASASVRIIFAPDQISTENCLDIVYVYWRPHFPRPPQTPAASF